MNTTNKQDQKNQRQKIRQKHRPKKPNMLQDDRRHQEHEHPETRMTR